MLHLAADFLTQSCRLSFLYFLVSFSPSREDILALIAKAQEFGSIKYLVNVATADDILSDYMYFIIERAGKACCYERIRLG